MAVFCFVFSSLHGQSYVFVGFCRHIYWKFWSRNSDTSILRGSFRETCEPLLRVSSFEHTMISKLHSNPKGDGQVICNYRKYLRPKSPKQRQPEHLIRVIRVLSTSHLMIQYDPIIFQMQPDHGGWPSKDDGWFAKNCMKGTYDICRNSQKYEGKNPKKKVPHLSRAIASKVLSHLLHTCKKTTTDQTLSQNWRLSLPKRYDKKLILKIWHEKETQDNLVLLDNTC